MLCINLGGDSLDIIETGQDIMRLSQLAQARFCRDDIGADRFY